MSDQYKQGTLKWPGHLERMNEDQTSKQIMKNEKVKSEEEKHQVICGWMELRRES